jgi:hypothetical protein
MGVNASDFFFPLPMGVSSSDFFFATSGASFHMAFSHLKGGLTSIEFFCFPRVLFFVFLVHKIWFFSFFNC